MYGEFVVWTNLLHHNLRVHDQLVIIQLFVLLKIHYKLVNIYLFSASYFFFWYNKILLHNADFPSKSFYHRKN